MNDQTRTKGRGAQHNPTNRFAAHSYESRDDYLEYCRLEDEAPESLKTSYIPVFPKTLVTPVNSPDVGFKWSINPYQGCEHGCTYCYARNSHEYWGYSAGKEFEQKILVKQNAVELLEKLFNKRTWKPDLIMLSGNTDCYQPAERKFGITRKLLARFDAWGNPVGIITKNSLILRDLDLLRSLNDKNLLRVTLSITTLNEQLRRFMEPRTASVKQRLKTLEVLSKAGIQVNVNMAPIVPGLNSHEVFDLVKTVADHGAHSAIYLLVRLNGQIGEIFETWVRMTYPERADKVLNQIKAVHQGQLNDTRWGKRMKGDGHEAENIRHLFQLAVKQYLNKGERKALDLQQYRKPGSQLYLF